MSFSAPPRVALRRRKRYLWIWLPLLLVVVMAALVAGILYPHFISQVVTDIPIFTVPPFGGKQEVHLLLLGVDDVKRTGGLSDTIIIASIDLHKHRLGAISIPRDFRVEIPGHGIQKINAAYSLGGINLTRQTVENLTGVTLDYYMICSFRGFQQIVDAMGGVELEVEKRMRYRDRSQQLEINLQPGRQRLTGYQAMGYVRFRHDARGDLGRIERQQTFLKAVADQLLRPGNSRLAPRTMEAICSNVKMERIGMNELRAIKHEVERVGLDNVRMASLSGRPHTIRGISYLEPDPQAAACLVDEIIYGRLPTLEVLNGTRIDKLAVTVAQKLANKGYPISTIGNAPASYSSSHVVNHSGWEDQARRVGELIGCRQVWSDRHKENDADITVVVGSDYISSANEAPRSRAY